MSPTVLIALVCLALALVAAWLAVRSMRRRARINNRMVPISELLVVEEAASAQPERRKERRQRGTSGPAAWLDARYPLAGGVRTAAIALAAGGLSFLVVWFALAFFGLPPTFATAVSVGVGAGVAWQTGTVMEQARRTEFSDRFLVVLEDLQRMVRHGIATPQALASVAAAAQQPAKASLGRVVLETGFGVPLGVALEREGQRIRVTELSLMAAIVGTQASTGGNLSEALENLAKMVRERRDARARMRASTAESRITLVILTLIPVAAIGIQGLSQPELVDVLMNQGRHLLGIGIALIVLGLGLAAMIIRSARRE